MKKKLIVIRFGTPTPTKGDMAAVSKITNGSMNAAGCPCPFGVVSIFLTDLSPAEVTSIYDETAEEMGDVLPTIVFEDGGPVGYNFNNPFFEHFKGCSAAFDEEYGNGRVECTMDLDQLLDLIREKGLENLTDVELTRLKELSK